MNLTDIKPIARFFRREEADIKGAIMGIAIVFIVLYILLIVLGNLIPVMTSAVPSDSPLSTAVTDLTNNTTTFFTIAALVGVIGVAMLIINMLS